MEPDALSPLVVTRNSCGTCPANRTRVSSDWTADYGAFMEPCGCNRWQPVANRSRANRRAVLESLRRFACLGGAHPRPQATATPRGQAVSLGLDSRGSL